jgi:hypothetical protein
LKRSTLKLLVPASAVYVFFLIFLKSIIPEKITPSVTLLALPLIILALILVSDLSNRAIVPSKNPIHVKSRRVRARDVQFLARQVDVASRASSEYFETIVLSRLRGLIVEKVSLEIGVDKERVKQELENRGLGPIMIGQKLHRLLYGSPPPRGVARVKMLQEAVDGIEAWKG